MNPVSSLLFLLSRHSSLYHYLVSDLAFSETYHTIPYHSVFLGYHKHQLWLKSQSLIGVGERSRSSSVCVAWRCLEFYVMSSKPKICMGLALISRWGEYTEPETVLGVARYESTLVYCICLHAPEHRILAAVEGTCPFSSVYAFRCLQVIWIAIV